MSRNTRGCDDHKGIAGFGQNTGRSVGDTTIGAGEAAQPVVIGLVDVTIFGTAAVLLLLLECLVFHTRLGTAMRAISYDPQTASLLGIPVDRVISVTFVLGSMLAGAAGFLDAMKYPELNQPAHATWVLLGLKAFVAAVVGGIPKKNQELQRAAKDVP